MFEVVETADGKWMLLCNGFQYGGDYDDSGAGDQVYETKGEALDALAQHVDEMKAILEAATRPAEEWLRIYQQKYPGFEIIDPAGWDRRPAMWEDSWNKPITRAEFDKRVATSICCFPLSMLNDAKETNNV